MQFAQFIAQLPTDSEWFNDPETMRVYTGFELADFDQAIGFLNEIAEIVEEIGVYPDLYLYDQKILQVSFKPEESGEFNPTALDLIEEIDALFEELNREAGK